MGSPGTPDSGGFMNEDSSAWRSNRMRIEIEWRSVEPVVSRDSWIRNKGAEMIDSDIELGY
jgi:hypothetical protein